MRIVPARYSRKPQYVLHPGRSLRRLTYRFRDMEGRTEITKLPWGLPLEVYMSDAIGFSIVAGGGVFDPAVTETLHRLIDPGDLIVDAGAHVGYVSSLATVRAHPGGEVLAFEPHPSVFELLERNRNRWRKDGNATNVDVAQVALSDKSGSGELMAGPSFSGNMGLSALRSSESDTESAEAISVPTERLDEVAGGRQVGVMKIDVEGHEAGVLRGGEKLLADGAVRDIVFEDHDPYPSEATAIVEDAGYKLISLSNDLFGLRLESPAARGEIEKWPGPSYLATLEPERALERLRPRGWRVDGIIPSFLRRPPASE